MRIALLILAIFAAVLGLLIVIFPQIALQIQARRMRAMGSRMDRQHFNWKPATQQFWGVMLILIGGLLFAVWYLTAHPTPPDPMDPGEIQKRMLEQIPGLN